MNIDKTLMRILMIVGIIILLNISAKVYDYNAPVDDSQRYELVEINLKDVKYNESLNNFLLDTKTGTLYYLKDKDRKWEGFNFSSFVKDSLPEYLGDWVPIIALEKHIESDSGKRGEFPKIKD